MAPAPGQWGGGAGADGVALGEGHWENWAIGNAFRACRLAAPELSAILVRFAIGLPSPPPLPQPVERCFLCAAMTGFIVLVTNVGLLCLR